VTETIRGKSRTSPLGIGRAGATLLVAAFAFSACSSSGASPTSGSTATGTNAATQPPASQSQATTGCKPADIRLVGQVRNVSNPYEATWLAGGEFFAAAVGLTEIKLTYGNDSQLQASQIRTLLATGKAECTAINIMPNGDSDTPVVVKAAQDAGGAWVVSQWNKPAALNPWDGYDNWITHITYDGKDAGYQIAKAMFEAMGGKGNIVAIQGTLDATAAKDRFVGLQKAMTEYPNIKLLDQQTGNWARAEALTITKTWLTKYGDQINGVWTANDDMGLGALEALKAAGKAGKVPVVGIDAVPEALKAIQDGNFTATITSDGYWQGGIGLAMGYCAMTGKLDPKSLPHDKRAFFAKQTLVDKANVTKYTTTPTAADYTSEWNCDNLFNRFMAPLVQGQ